MRPQWLMPIVLTSIIVLTTLPVAAQVIHVEPRNIDLGQMNQEEIRETTITVTNRGQDVLQIHEIKADCGCTVAELDKQRLLPGESTTLHVTFESKKFYGITRKAMHLYTNDRQNPVLDIMVQADIFTPLIVSPRFIKFPNTSQGLSRTMWVNFEAADVPEIQLTAKSTQKGLYDFDIVHGVDGDPQKAKVAIILPEDIETGMLEDYLTVTTNIPEEPYVELRIQAIVNSVLVASPEKVNFRFRKQFKQEVRIRPFMGGQMDFKVTNIEIDVPGLTAEITGGQPGFEVVIRLTGRPIGKNDPLAIENEGRIKGTLTVHTDHEALPVIEVPVSYLVRM